jgi:thioredoxin
MVIEGTDENINDLLDTDIPVLLYFSAPWCSPCKVFAPVVEEISNEYENLVVIKIDIEQSPDITNRANIRSVPLIAMVFEGEILRTMSGAVPKAKLEKFIERD